MPIAERIWILYSYNVSRSRADAAVALLLSVGSERKNSKEFRYTLSNIKYNNRIRSKENVLNEVKIASSVY